MKKVAILSNEHSWTYNLRKETIEALIREGYEVSIILPYGEKVELLKKMGCIFYDAPMFERRGKNVIKDLKLLKRYFEILRKIRPDVVLTYTIKPNTYGGFVASLFHIPFIANVTGLGTSIENGGFLSSFTKEIYKIGLKHAECVFFQNTNNQALFREKRIYKGKSQVIPGSGVNISLHNYEPYPSEKNGIRFLFVGRIMKDKGIEELLQSICLIHQNRNDVTLDIVGFCDEDYSDELKTAFQEGAIRYHGEQSFIHEFYKNCHCVVLPSYHEGMANVLLEASSTGRPIIATKIPGCQEILEEKVTGFGCNAKSIDSLKEAMDKFISASPEQHEKMGISARKKVEKEFNRELVVKAYLKEIAVICS